MIQNSKIFFIHCMTPLHAGSGSELGVVDLPIQREIHTSLPKIEASTLKGAIRSSFHENTENNNIVFGPLDKGDYAGALSISDAKLLFFPVKSAKGVFAYVTSKMVLEKYIRDLNLTGSGNNGKEGLSIPKVSEGECIVLKGNENIIENEKNEKNVLLEEYTFKAKEAEVNFDIFNNIEKKIVILSDDDFKDFTNLSTEVITRIRINPETGTVQQGALFTEEYLPEESILYAVAMASKPFVKDKEDEEIKKAEDVLKYFNNISDYIQIGGNANLGKGMVRIIK